MIISLYTIQHGVSMIGGSAVSPPTSDKKMGKNHRGRIFIYLYRVPNSSNYTSAQPLGDFAQRSKQMVGQGFRIVSPHTTCRFVGECTAAQDKVQLTVQCKGRHVTSSGISRRALANSSLQKCWRISSKSLRALPTG